MVNVNDFEKEVSCSYRGESYLVRDNGAVLRLAPEGKHARKLDNEWTFGKKNETNGYMTIGEHRVHIIVATAFHGTKDSKIYVVDHIDTNRCNNRPENLRWLTKLENVLLNEFTRKKIEFICGSVENFLSNPSLLRGHESQDANFCWMRTVSKEEAENTLYNWRSFLSRPKINTNNPQPIGDWIYGHGDSPLMPVTKTPEHVENIISTEQRKEEADKMKEQEKAAKANARKEEAKEKRRQDKEDKKTIIESLRKVASLHKWEVQKNVSEDGWKADLLISTSINRIGVKISKTSRNVHEELEAMKRDGIIGCCLGCTCDSYYDSNLYPSFKVEVTETGIFVIVSSSIKLSVEEFIQAMNLDRLKIKDVVTINSVKVRFFPIECYKCHSTHFAYMVNELISDEISDLSCYSNQYHSEEKVDEFHPKVIECVQNYLTKHPELGYNMGEIKKRFSKTREEEYTSFGCPNCDALVGDWYLNDIKLEIIYEPEDEYVHTIELDESGIQLPIKHWILI